MASPSCCTTGRLHNGTPKGTITTLHDLPTYRAEPSNNISKGVIVMIPDAFGWEFPNLRLMADNYAERGGFTVVMPDFMNGTGIDYNMIGTMETFTDKNVSMFSRIPAFLHSLYHFVPFMISNRLSISQPRVFSFFRALRAANPTTPIGCAGYCWGGKFVFQLCAGDETVSTPAGPKQLVDAGFTAHPSNLAIPSDAERVALPLSVAQGTEDFVLSGEPLRKLQEVLEAKNGGGVELCEVVIYPGAKHGFSVKGDEKDEAVRKQAEEAEVQAVRWWTRKLLGEEQ